jgi:short subunit dehydrogenase-like uncharacterized protein
MTVVLYGATGYTGRLVTDELVRRGADFVLGGRSRDRLERLSRERGGGAPVRVAHVDQRASLDALLEGASVLVNCAGPFTLAGEPVVRAAVENGVHYVDSTGEQGFIQMVFERYGEHARAAGVVLVPALGFDIVPGDCAARLAAAGLEPLEELTVAYAVEEFGASQGTARSAVEGMASGDLVYEDGEWRGAGLRLERPSFDFGAPLGRQAMVRFPGGEVVTVPRHTRTEAVRVLITASTLAPHARLAPAVPFVQPGLALALRTPLRAVVRALVDRLPEGPSEEDRRAARFTVEALARGRDGRTARARVSGRDVYGLTAAALAYGAERLAAGDHERAGALGPAAAFDPHELLDALAAFDLRVETPSP